MVNQTRGIDHDDDIHSGLVHADFRSKRVRRLDNFKEYGSLWLVLGGVLVIFAPILAEVSVLVALFVFHTSCKRGTNYQALAMPEHALPNKKRPLFYPRGRYRFEQSLPGGNVLLGVDRKTKQQVWENCKRMNRHIFIAGTTGSGKTIFLFGIIYMYIVLGSGCCMIDAKGTNTAFWHFFSLARRLDRADDVYIINFLKASLETSPDLLKGKYRTTNTIQPFETGSPEELRSLLGTMFRSMKDEIWKSKALALLYSILIVLCDRRDRLNQSFSVNDLREYMRPKYALSWAYDENIPEQARNTIVDMLGESGGFKESILVDPKTGEPRDEQGIQEQLADPNNAEFQTQWSYLTMQMTESFQMLGVEYKGIFGVVSGEIDFKDMVLQRRLCFIILPSLEKDNESLAVLAKFLIAGLKRFFSAVMGSDIQGVRSDVYDADKTKYHVPFAFICDEINRYGAEVEGLGAAAALARALGIVFIFAGQQFASLIHKNRGEFKEMWGNTVYKVAMLVDEDETVEQFQKRVSQAYVNKARHLEKEGDGNVYFDRRTAEIEKEDRLDIRALSEQKAGEAYLIHQDQLMRINVFGALAEEAEGHITISPDLKLNELYPIRAPSPELVEAYLKPVQKLKALADHEESVVEHDTSKVATHTQRLANAIKVCRKNTALNHTESTLLALALLCENPSKMHSLIAESQAQEITEHEKPDASSDDTTESFSQEDEKLWEQAGSSELEAQREEDAPPPTASSETLSEMDKAMELATEAAKANALSLNASAEIAEKWEGSKDFLQGDLKDKIKNMHRLDAKSLQIDEEALNKYTTRVLTSPSIDVDKYLDIATHYQGALGKSLSKEIIIRSMESLK